MRKNVIAFLLGMMLGLRGVRKLTHLIYLLIIVALLFRPSKIVWSVPKPGVTQTKIEYVEKPVVVEKVVERLVEKPAAKPENWINGDDSHYVGSVMKLVMNANHDGFNCIALTFAKDDGTNVVFSLNQWPPTWEKMHGEILLKAAYPCGYSMVSAKEWK